MQAPDGRPRAGDHRGDGCAARDGVATDAGAVGSGSFQGGHGRPRCLRVRARPGSDSHRARADRRHRDDHALELAGKPDCLQACTGARGRLHHGSEAERDGTALGAGDRRNPARGGRAERRLQSGQRRRADGRCRARRSPRHRHDLLYRLDARRNPGGQGGSGHGQEGRARARRQIAQHPARRCGLP